MKKILGYGWPFLALAVILFFTWNYVKQFLPESWRGENPVASNPIVVYDMREEQDDLSPMGINERMAKQERYYSESELAAQFGEARAVSSADELAGAIKTAADGDVFVLGPGEYRLNLVITEDITLTGAGSSSVLLAADQEQPVIKSAGAKLTLANLAVKDAKIGLEAEGGEIAVKRVKFENLSATACWGAGVKLDFSESYIYNSRSALKLVDSAGTVADSIIKDNAKSGVELRRSDFAVTGNVITGNKSYGVFLDGYAAAEIKNNFISGNKGWNVRMEGERRIYK